MFDFLKRTPSSQVDKLIKRLTETGGEDGPRIEAAEKLASLDTPDATYALLKRFTMSSKVISQDVEEKHMIVNMIVEKGETAVEPILKFMKAHHQVEWPVRILMKILPEEQWAPRLVEILKDVAQNPFTSPEHRTSLIKAMHGHITPEIAATLRTLLEDDDDDVSIAAIQAIAEMGEEVREPLLQIFIRADNRPRLRIAIAELCADREWPVKGYRPSVEAVLPAEFHITAKGMIRRKGVPGLNRYQPWVIICLAVWLTGTVAVAIVATQNFYTIDRLLESSPNASFNTAVKTLNSVETPNHPVARDLLRYLSSELNRLYFEYWNLAQLGIGVLALWLVSKMRGVERVKWCIVAMLGVVLFVTIVLMPPIVRIGRSLDFVPRESPPPEVVSALRTFGLLHVTYTVMTFGIVVLGILATLWVQKPKAVGNLSA